MSVHFDPSIPVWLSAFPIRKYDMLLRKYDSARAGLLVVE